MAAAAAAADDNNWVSVSSRWFVLSLSKDTVLRIEGRILAVMALDLTTLVDTDEERVWWAGTIRWWLEAMGAQGE